jgi:hypothetical protein
MKLKGRCSLHLLFCVYKARCDKNTYILLMAPVILQEIVFK